MADPLVNVTGDKGNCLRGCVLGQVSHVEAFAGKSSGEGAPNSDSDAKTAKCHPLKGKA